MACIVPWKSGIYSWKFVPPLLMEARGELCAQSLSHVQLFVIPQTVAHQALLSMEEDKIPL